MAQKSTKNFYFPAARVNDVVDDITELFTKDLSDGGVIDGQLNMLNVPTFADNAAAVTGGLILGDVYKTATGELRIRV